MQNKKIRIATICCIFYTSSAFSSSNLVSVESFSQMRGVFKNSHSVETMYYTLPSIKGGEVTSSAVLIKSNYSDPIKGSGLVVLTYGTVGVAPQCAPLWGVKTTDKPDFLNIPRYWDSASYDTIDYYLSKGFSVMAVNKEGQANKDFRVEVTYGEPYANKISMANTINYAVLAANEVLGESFSGDWVITGHSQGGQTVFAVAEDNDIFQQNTNIHFKGGVALSPAMSIPAIFKDHEKSIEKLSNVMNINDGDSELGRTVSIAINFLHSLTEAGFKPNIDKILGGNLKKNYENLMNNSCVGEQINFITDDIANWRFANANATIMDYVGFNINAFLDDRDVQKGMDQWEVSNATITGKILVIVGKNDEFVPYPSVEYSVKKMQDNGNKIDFITIENADHQGYIRSQVYQDKIQDYVTGLLDK